MASVVEGMFGLFGPFYNKEQQKKHREEVDAFLRVYYKKEPKPSSEAPSKEEIKQVGNKVREAIKPDPKIIERVNTPNKEGQLLLEDAVKLGDAGIQSVMALINNDANVNARTQEGKSMLHLAVEAVQHSSAHNLVGRLLENGVHIDARDSEDKTALHKAASIGGKAQQVMEAILNGQPDPNIQDKDGKTALHYAVASENGYSIIKALLKYQANPIIEDNKGQTTLHLAAIYGNEVIIQLLLQQGIVNVNAKDKDGQTPLHLAARYAKSEVIALLANEGDANPRDNTGKTPLHLAVIWWNMELGSFSKRPNWFKIKFDEVRNRLSEERNRLEQQKKTLSEQYRATVIALLKNKANINDKDDNDYTALHFAVETQRDDVTKDRSIIINLLLDKGANPKAINKDGNTPFMCAVAWGISPLIELQGGKRVEMLALLMGKGEKRINVNDMNHQRATALHYAMMLQVNAPKIVNFLIEQGAGQSVSIPTGNNNDRPLDILHYILKYKKPLDEQARQNLLAIKEILKKQGAILDKGRPLYKVQSLTFTYDESRYSLNWHEVDREAVIRDKKEQEKFTIINSLGDSIYLEEKTRPKYSQDTDLNDKTFSTKTHYKRNSQ